MGEVEHILFKALHTLSLKAPSHSLLPNALERIMHESEEMSVRIESVTTERGLGEPNRITIELTDWAGLFRRPRRPGVYTDDARRGYDYEGTAEEIVEIDGPRKELPSG